MTDSHVHDSSMTERHERGRHVESVTELIALGRDREAVDAATRASHPEPTRQELEQELLALAEAHNTSTNGTLRIPSEYLEVVAEAEGP